MHVFLSPHLDDAVLSCGGTLAHLHEAGAPCLVVNVMAGALPQPLPDTPIVRELHARWQAGADPMPVRRAEDARALAIVGAQGLYLPLPDCVYRMHGTHALYPDEASLWGAIHPDDPAHALLDALATFAALGITQPVSTLYVPLGVGQHVDHRLVRAWGVRLTASQPNVRLLFYTDYPYFREQQHIDTARAELGLPLESVWQPLTDAQFAAKLDGVAAYTSQLSTFWASETHMRKALAAHFRDENGRFAERYWQIAALTHKMG